MSRSTPLLLQRSSRARGEKAPASEGDALPPCRPAFASASMRSRPGSSNPALGPAAASASFLNIDMDTNLQSRRRALLPALCNHWPADRCPETATLFCVRAQTFHAKAEPPPRW